MGIKYDADVYVFAENGKVSRAYKRLMEIIGQFTNNPAHVVTAEQYREESKSGWGRERFKVSIRAA